MLHELDILEAGRIADLALDARKVRDRLLEEVPEADLGEPVSERGEHNPAAGIMLDTLLAEPEFVALRQALAVLPRDIREKLWVVTRIGRGDVAISDWEPAIGETSALTDEDIVTGLLDEPDLHECLRKGLYVLGAARTPGDAG
jgi:hypothetical protein